MMSLTHDRKAAKRAIETLKAVASQLTGPTRVEYQRALDLVCRYNVSLRQARPVEVIQQTQNTALIDQLKAQVADLENQLAQSKRQLEREKIRPIDFDGAYPQFIDWAQGNVELNDLTNYAQISIKLSARKMIELCNGNTDPPDPMVDKQSCIEILKCVSDTAKAFDPQVAHAIDLFWQEFQTRSHEEMTHPN